MQTRATILALAALLAGCSGSKNDTSDTSDTSVTDSGAGQFPADPRPVSITFGGDVTDTIAFDQPTCSEYPPQTLTSFRNFWRGSDHNAVLIVQVLGGFHGAGTYDSATDPVTVTLQSEAGSPYNFSYALDTAHGDTASLTIDSIDGEAWGHFSFSALHDSSGGEVTALPMPIPIWCPSVDNGSG